MLPLRTWRFTQVGRNLSISTAVSPKVLHLVRHAQSNWNVSTAGEHVGQHPTIVDIDSRLSELGQRQAQAQSWDVMQPPPELVLSSPLSRAVETALALVGTQGVEIRAEPLATEWCENSCDLGRPGMELAQEYSDKVSNLEALGGEQWWPLSHAEISAGGRETEASVDQRCAALLAKVRGLPQSSVAIVAHCMVLDKLQRMIGMTTDGGDCNAAYQVNLGGKMTAICPTYMSNTEVRTLQI